MKLKVERRHINKGQRGDTNSCPIALALVEALNLEPGSANVSGLGIIDLCYQEYCLSFEYSRAVEEFTVNFDRARKVNPTEFDLKMIGPDAYD